MFMVDAVFHFKGEKPDDAEVVPFAALAFDQRAVEDLLAQLGMAIATYPKKLCCVKIICQNMADGQHDADELSKLFRKPTHTPPDGKH